MVLTRSPETLSRSGAQGPGTGTCWNAKWAPEQRSDSRASAPAPITNSRHRRSHLHRQLGQGTSQATRSRCANNTSRPLFRSAPPMPPTPEAAEGHLLGVKSQSPLRLSPAPHTLVPRAETRLERFGGDYGEKRKIGDFYWRRGVAVKHVPFCPPKVHTPDGTSTR